jgi:hypothetical protein
MRLAGVCSTDRTAVWLYVLVKSCLSHFPDLVPASNEVCSPLHRTPSTVGAVYGVQSRHFTIFLHLFRTRCQFVADIQRLNPCSLPKYPITFTPAPEPSHRHCLFRGPERREFGWDRSRCDLFPEVRHCRFQPGGLLGSGCCFHYFLHSPHFPCIQPVLKTLYRDLTMEINTATACDPPPPHQDEGIIKGPEGSHRHEEGGGIHDSMAFTTL